MTERDLYGTWRLVSATGRDVTTGETTDFFVKAPRGFLSYGRDGRMSAILVMDDRPRPADMAKATDAERVRLFDTMAAYAGAFTVSGGTVTHHVDVSWNENWTGTDQLRHFRIVGDRLYITGNLEPSNIDSAPMVAELVWEKVE